MYSGVVIVCRRRKQQHTYQKRQFSSYVRNKDKTHYEIFLFHTPLNTVSQMARNLNATNDLFFVVHFVRRRYYYWYLSAAQTIIKANCVCAESRWERKEGSTRTHSRIKWFCCELNTLRIRFVSYVRVITPIGLLSALFDSIIVFGWRVLHILCPTFFCVGVFVQFKCHSQKCYRLNRST